MKSKSDKKATFTFGFVYDYTFLFVLNYLTVFVDSASKNENATSKKSEPHFDKKKNKN